jgi:hypothetical protein
LEHHKWHHTTHMALANRSNRSVTLRPTTPAIFISRSSVLRAAAAVSIFARAVSKSNPLFCGGDEPEEQAPTPINTIVQVEIERRASGAGSWGVFFYMSSKTTPAPLWQWPPSSWLDGPVLADGQTWPHCSLCAIPTHHFRVSPGPVSSADRRAGSLC